MKHTSQFYQNNMSMSYKVLATAIFAFFLAMIWALLFFCYQPPGALGSPLGILFFCIISVAHAAEFALCIFVVMLLLSLLPKKTAAVSNVLLVTGVTLFLLADFFVYRQFRLHLDMAMLSMFFGNDSAEIFVFPPVMYVQAALGALAVLLVMGGAFAASRRLAQRRAGGKVLRLYALLAVFILTFHGTHAWARFTVYAPFMSQTAALPLVQGLSMNSLLSSMGFEQGRDLPRLEPHSTRYPLAALEFEPPEKMLNLVIIMLDSWRFDMLDDEVAPNIYEFSHKAQRFTRHTAASNHTRHGVFSFFYGLPGTYWAGVLSDRASPVLLNSMVENNYQFGVFASAGLASPEFNHTVFTLLPDLAPAMPSSSKATRDIMLTDAFMNFMDKRNTERPFFSFLLYDATHAYTYDPAIAPPKYLPDQQKNYLSVSDTQLNLNRYKNAVRFVDALVQKVLDRLEQENLLENTVVIITSDHGEEFNDTGLGYHGHNGNFSKYQVRVPLVVYWPGRDGAIHDYPTSHMDIPPALMKKLFGCITPPEQYCAGLDLFSREERQYFFIAGASGSYAVKTDDIITVFPNIGPSYTMNAEEYTPTGRRMNADLYHKILLALSRFKK